MQLRTMTSWFSSMFNFLKAKMIGMHNTWSKARFYTTVHSVVGTQLSTPTISVEALLDLRALLQTLWHPHSLLNRSHTLFLLIQNLPWSPSPICYSLCMCGAARAGEARMVGIHCHLLRACEVQILNLECTVASPSPIVCQFPLLQIL